MAEPSDAEQAADGGRPSIEPLGHATPAQKRAIVILAAVLAAAGALSTAFLPYLLVEYPAGLLALSTNGRNLLLTAGQLDFGTVFIIGTLRRALAMLSTYWLAALYGRRMLRFAEEKAPRFAPVLRFLERLFIRFGPPLLVVLPIYSICGMAGATGTPLRRFVAPMVIGQAAYVVVAYFFGEILTTWTDQLIAWLSAHEIEATIATAAAVGIYQVLAAVRRRRQASKQSHIDDAQAS